MAKTVRLNAIFKTLMSVVNIIFPLITAPYIARVISIDGFTEFNKAQSMISWFSPFAVFGVYTYGMRTMSQIRNDKGKTSLLFTKLFALNSITSLIVTGIYSILVLLLPSFTHYRNLYLIFSFQLLAICFATDWANEAFESYGFILIKTFICRLLYVLSVFIFVRGENDILIYVILTTLSLLINNVLTFCYAKLQIKFVKFRFIELKELIKPLFIVFLLVNSSMLYTIFDRFVLTFFGNKMDLTYYNMSQTIVMAMLNVTSSIILVSIPRLSFYWAQNDKSSYYSLLEKSSSFFLALHTPCCIGIACLSYEVMNLYGGQNYLNGFVTLLIFSIRYYVSAYDIILAKQVLLATGNEKFLTKIYYIGGGYNILCKAILVCINKLTPEICVITTMNADMLVIFLQLLQIKKLGLNFSIFSKNSIKYLLTSLLFIPITFLIKIFISDVTMSQIVLRCLISIILCGIVYFIMLFVSKDNLIMLVFRKLNKDIVNEENF